jgi:hypothetical protein
MMSISTADSLDAIGVNVCENLTTVDPRPMMLHPPSQGGMLA